MDMNDILKLLGGDDAPDPLKFQQMMMRKSALGFYRDLISRVREAEEAGMDLNTLPKGFGKLFKATKGLNPDIENEADEIFRQFLLHAIEYQWDQEDFPENSTMEECLVKYNWCCDNLGGQKEWLESD